MKGTYLKWLYVEPIDEKVGASVMSVLIRKDPKQYVLDFFSLTIPNMMNDYNFSLTTLAKVMESPSPASSLSTSKSQK
jgi:hypothetical protein